jgi:sodium-dependent dicarboxylate transporter 2/3/5
VSAETGGAQDSMELIAAGRRDWLDWARQAVTVLVPVTIWFVPVGLPPAMQHGLSIMAFMVIGWIVEVMDYAITGLIGCFLFWALGIVKIDLAFSGFADSTAWFIFAAMLLGTLSTKTGLAARLANFVMRRVGPSYAGVLLGLVIVSFLLTPIVPSGISRVAIVATVAIGLIEAFGLKRGSNAARGMFLVTTYSAALFDKFMVSGAASITARGLMESAGGVSVSWSEWFLAYAPCDIVVVVASWWLALKLFPAEQETLSGGASYLEAQAQGFGPMTALQKRAALFLLAALLLWVTDFLHHISPAIVGIGVVLAALLPRVGVLSVDDLKKNNLLPFIFVASAISMANVLTATKGLAVVTDFVFASMLPLMTSPLQSTTILYWFAFIYHFALASEISMLASSVPPLMTFAKANGLNPKFIGMVWTFAAGGKLFAYQNAVLVVGYSFGYFKGRDLIKFGLILTIIEFIALVPTVLFFWPLIGLR